MEEFISLGLSPARTKIQPESMAMAVVRSSPFLAFWVLLTDPRHLQRAEETSTKVSCPALAPRQRVSPSRFVCAAARNNPDVTSLTPTLTSFLVPVGFRLARPRPARRSPPAPERHNPPGVHGVRCRNRKSIDATPTAAILRVFIQF